MKNIKIFLLTFLLPLCAAAQDGQLIKFGGSRPQDTAYAARSLRLDSVLRALYYATSDTNKVLGINAQGYLTLRTKGTGSGITTDTSSLSDRINARVKYTDTAAMLSAYYRTATATAALATKQDYSDTNSYDATKKNLADTSALLRSLISGSVSGVSSVSATDGNGFDFTITNATSTPNIALDLQADHNFVSDAQLVVLGNTSGTNTGDQTTITGNAGTATTLQTGRTIGILTGDATSSGSTFNGSANNTNAVTLASVNSNVGSFGSASAVGTFTVNAKGLTTAAGSTSIQIAESQVTNLVTDLAGKVNTSDTAAMLANYLRTATAAATYAPISTTVTLTGTQTLTNKTLTSPSIATPLITGLSSGTANDSVLVADASTGAVKRRNAADFAGGGSGISGLTASYLPKAATSTTLTNSRIFDNGSFIALGGNTQYGFAAPGITMHTTATAIFDAGSNDAFVTQYFSNSWILQGYGSNILIAPDGSNVTVNDYTHAASAAFKVGGTTRASLLSPLTTAQINAISSPATGLQAYDTDLKHQKNYDGAAWRHSPNVYTGTAAPATTPLMVGDLFVDTTGKKIYCATGTSSSADWTILN